jgi:GTP-binding protein
LTKSDKLSKNKQITQKKSIADALGVPKEQPILFSAKSRMGKDDLWKLIEQLF